MALVSCHECSNKVSNTASACPRCGAPVSEAAGSKAAGAPLTTVQETSKKLKMHILIASVLFWVGVIWFFIQANMVNEGGEITGTPAAMIFGGMIWYFVTRFRIWWHHK